MNDGISVEIEISDWTFEGETILRAELIQTYGFVADQFTATIDAQAARDALPDLLRRDGKDQEIHARMWINNVTRNFWGRTDPTTATLQEIGGEIAGDINLSARSRLADLLDDPENEEMAFGGFENQDWADVVRQAVEHSGFIIGQIEATNVLAGEKDELGIFFLEGGKFPRELINEAVLATGFNAGLDNDGRFSFRQGASVSFGPHPVFVLGVAPSEDGPGGPAEALQAVGGDLTQMRSREPAVVDPGGALEVVTPVQGLNGVYYSGKSRYERRGRTSIAEFDLSREPPDARNNSE